jgi:NAD-dependent DNA ligase
MNKESPIRTPKVSTKAIENEEIEAQVAAKTVIDAFQPLVNALTSQVAQLSAALEEQRIAFTCQYKALQAEFTTQIENLKAEIATSISTQLSNVYVLAPPTTSSYAAVAQSTTVGTPSPRSPPLS